MSLPSFVLHGVSLRYFIFFTSSGSCQPSTYVSGRKSERDETSGGGEAVAQRA